MAFITWTVHGIRIARLELPWPLLIIWCIPLAILLTGYAPHGRRFRPLSRKEEPIQYWIVFALSFWFCFLATWVLNAGVFR